MNLQDFIAKYEGKGIDEDGGYGFQCVDLVNQYVKEVLRLSRWSGNAVDKWTNYPKGDYDRFDNTPSAVPLPGDIIIWGKGAGPYGHIAVVVSANVNNFVSFDQNWPLGSVCRKVTHTYGNVLGWLRPKRKDTMSQAERDELAQLRVFRDQVRNGKVNEFRKEGSPTVFQIYAIPDEGHFAFLGNDWNNVHNIPADWDINPRTWLNNREWLRGDVMRLTSEKEQMQSFINERDAQIAKYQSEKNSYEARLLAAKIELDECNAKVCPECPPTTVPVYEMPSQGTPKKVTLEDLIVGIFKAIFRKK